MMNNNNNPMASDNSQNSMMDNNLNSMMNDINVMQNPLMYNNILSDGNMKKIQC